MHGEWASLHPESSRGRSYWKEGSVGSGGRNMIAVPVLSVGCLHGGGYANSTPRLARALGPNRVKAVMGSWVHNYPHLSKSGPAFGFSPRSWTSGRAPLRPGQLAAGIPGRTDATSPVCGPRRIAARRRAGDGAGTCGRVLGRGTLPRRLGRRCGAFCWRLPRGKPEADPRLPLRRDGLDISQPQRSCGTRRNPWASRPDAVHLGDGDDLPTISARMWRWCAFVRVTVETALTEASRVTVVQTGRGVGSDTHSAGSLVSRSSPDGPHRITTACNVSALQSSTATRSSVSSYVTSRGRSTFAVPSRATLAFCFPVG